GFSTPNGMLAVLEGCRPTAGNIAWAEHAPSTVARYGPHPIRHLTGTLEEAAAGRAQAGGSGQPVFGLTMPRLEFEQAALDSRCEQFRGSAASTRTLWSL